MAEGDGEGGREGISKERKRSNGKPGREKKKKVKKKGQRGSWGVKRSWRSRIKESTVYTPCYRL